MRLILCLFFCLFIGCTYKTEIPSNDIRNNKRIEFENFQINLLKEHNDQRLSKGLNSLEISKELCRYAQNHAELMSKKNSLYHSKMNDLRMVLNSEYVGENIAWGQEDEREVVNSWMWSPGHRWNILGASYKRVGFGMKLDSNNRKYWCVVFSD